MSNGSFTLATFVSQTVSDSDTWQSRDCTCLCHLGWCDTDRIVSIFVAPPKVAKASKEWLSHTVVVCQCRPRYRANFCQWKHGLIRAVLFCATALLALATLGGTTQIGSFLFSLRWLGRQGKYNYVAVACRSHWRYRSNLRQCKQRLKGSSILCYCLTCLGHLGRHNTDIIVSIFVMPPRVAKASTTMSLSCVVVTSVMVLTFVNVNKGLKALLQWKTLQSYHRRKFQWQYNKIYYWTAGVAHW